MDYLASIDSGLNTKRDHGEIARKIFLTHPTYALVGHEEEGFEILNSVSIFLDVPITSVQVVGSAKIGESFHKNTIFSNKTSDLDIAVIDPGLFRKYSEHVFTLSKGFTDETQFSSSAIVDEYLRYLSKGIFRPDLMPSGRWRADLNRFFGQLSLKYEKLFKSINASIYFSQVYFESKQRSVIAARANKRRT